jgi:hypothetical protein
MLLKEAVPTARRVGELIHPHDPSQQRYPAALKGALARSAAQPERFVMGTSAMFPKISSTQQLFSGQFADLGAQRIAHVA